MHESKGQHIGKAPFLHLFHTILITMTMQSAAHSSSGSRLYQRHVIRVPLSIQTYDSVVKVWHGFSTIPRQLVVHYRKTPMYCLTVV